MSENKLILSVIVISQNNALTIEKTLNSIFSQNCPFPFEVILVNSGSDQTVEIAKTRFPNLQTIKLPKPALPGRARNAGAKVARGKFLSFPGAHIELEQGSLKARVDAHLLGHVMVSGAMVNGTFTPAGWASYFVDHAGTMPLVPSGPLQKPPSSCSYERNALFAVGLFPEDRRAGEDTFVNQKLWDNGHSAYRDNRIILTHISRCTTPWLLARHHFVRGKAFGRIQSENGVPISFFKGYSRRRFGTIQENLKHWGGDMQDIFHRYCWLVRLAVLSALIGALFEMTKRQWLQRRS